MTLWGFFYAFFDITTMQTTTDYVTYASHEAKIGEVKKCVLLYSGGLDTSCMLKRIQEAYNCEVIALTIDLGQLADDLDEIKQKAFDLWAVEAIVVDAKEIFAEQYLAKAIQANASYQGNYHLSTPIGRPLLAKIAVDIAHEYGADCIAHGCTGKGNDQVRLETTVLCYDPGMKVIAPVRQWAMGRTEELEYAAKHNIPVKQTADIPYSRDDNMRWLTGEWGEIENPELAPKLANILQITNLPENAPDEWVELEIWFSQWVPVSIDGEQMQLHEIIQQLNIIGWEHAIGYTILIEDRLVWLKVRGVYENPGAEIIITAHKNLEKLVSTQEENKLKEYMDQQWAYLCYSAKRMEPTFDHINAYIADHNAKVTGTVTVSLYKGNLHCTKVVSPNSLFDHSLATFEKDASFNQNSSAGFIEVYGLAMKTAHSIGKK